MPTALIWQIRFKIRHILTKHIIWLSVGRMIQYLQHSFSQVCCFFLLKHKWREICLITRNWNWTEICYQCLHLVIIISAMSIKIGIGQRFLVCETLVNDKFKNQTKGLMGNFDGIKSNDFVLPNGSILDEGKTNTERQIFYNFGQLCKPLWKILKKSSSWLTFIFIFKYIQLFVLF